MPTSTEMLTELHARADELQERRATLLRDLSTLSETQLAFQPAAGAWSIRQVIEHLLLVDGGIIERVTTRSPRAGRRQLRDRLGYAAVWVALRYGLRVKAPVRGVLPAEGVALDAAAKRWGEVHRSLSAHLSGLGGQELSLFVFKHPIGGPMTLGEAIQFMTSHLEHHRRQIARIRQTAAFPRGEEAAATLVS